MNHSTNKAERIRALAGVKGIPSLLREAYEILGNPILLHDMEYKVIAYNQNVTTDDPIWNEYTTTGTVGSHWLDFFKEECFLETAANAKKITFLTSDKLTYNRIFGKLFNKNSIQIGCACMVACDKPFEDDDAALFEALCEILSRELGRDEFYNDYGQAYLEKLLCELMNGITDIELYTAHVESIYMHLKANLYLAVVELGACDSKDPRLAHVRDLLKQTQPEYTYAVYGSHILIILGTDDAALYVDKDLYQLNRLFHEHNFHAGISRRFENLFALRTHYKEALAALNHGLAVTGQRVFLHEP